ncbi:TetR/AcrR family transcriptional regulator C-terminal domain-containing protein [Streptomyces sp. NPDC056653]|uniref:TetR/AcrR family transcriptional regulator C-terminal domain-containing protein n=1 Tax=Streptomyces sp. NPDC056653 TaxID=3345894 RepID=UPI0036A2D2BB
MRGWMPLPREPGKSAGACSTRRARTPRRAGEREAAGRDGFDIGERAERMAQYPLAAAAGAEIFAHYEERFEDGLRLIVAGIEARYRVR